MEDEDVFSMTMEKEEEAGIGFSKMEMFYGEDEKHVVDNLTNDAFYVGRKLSTNRKVPGNIHREEYQDFWMNKIKPSQMIKDVIEHKYRLPFSSEPPRSFVVWNMIDFIDPFWWYRRVTIKIS